MSTPSYGGLAAEDIETISNDPPLPFFVLFEAMQQPQAEGLHLGPLGSIIVAEVVFGAIERARHVSGHGSGPLAAQLANISGNHYATNAFSEIPDINCMAQLAEFTAEIAGLQKAVPAFL
jgi:hypothetical protein